MNSKHIAIIFLAAAILFVGNVSFADAKGDNLNAAIAHLKCSDDFTANVLQSFMTNVPSASLTSNINALRQDETTLQGYVSSGDTKGYGDYLHQNYDSDLKAANDALKDARKANANLTNTTRASLRSDYDTFRATYETCSLNALKLSAMARIEDYKEQIAAYQANANNLSSKGVDASGLLVITGNAQSQIVDPLQTAVNAATNSSDLKGALNKYCLYDGCKNGVNYHLSALYDSEKLSKVISFTQSRYNTNTSSPKFNDALGDVNAAKAVLTTVGTSQYTNDQSKQFWDDMKAASMALKQAIIESRNNARQAAIAARQKSRQEKSLQKP